MKIKNKIFNIIVISACVISFGFILFAVINQAKNESSQYLYLNYDWTVVDSEENSISVNIPIDFNSSKNSMNEISKTIPDINKDCAICFHSNYQNVYVKLDGKIIYEYNITKNLPFGKVSPPQWHFIDISKEDSEKVFTIGLISPYLMYSGVVDNIYIGQRDILFSEILKLFFVKFITCIILMFLGLLISISAYIMGKKQKEYLKLRYMGYLAFLMGLSIFAAINLPNGGIFDPFARTVISYISFLLLPFPFLIYIKERAEKKYALLISILTCLYSLYFIFVILFQIFGIFDFKETATYTYAIFVFILAGATYLYILGAKQKRYKYILYELVGICSLCICAIIEVVLYYTNIMEMTGEYMVFGTFIYIATLLFANAMLVFNQAEDSRSLVKQLHETQIQLMISQIQPHFIYNALASIRAMIKSSPNTAYRLLYDFSIYLRYNIDALRSSDLILFSDELKHIKAYLNIEQARFENRLTVLYEIDFEDFYLPPLSIQPIVENAVKHGVCKKIEGGTVVVKSYETDNNYIIKIVDTGIGFNTQKINAKAESIGLDNIKKRLSELVDAEVLIDSELKVGTTVTVILPKISKTELLKNDEDDFSR